MKLDIHPAHSASAEDMPWVATLAENGAILGRGLTPEAAADDAVMNVLSAYAEAVGHQHVFMAPDEAVKRSVPLVLYFANEEDRDMAIAEFTAALGPSIRTIKV